MLKITSLGERLEVEMQLLHSFTTLDDAVQL